MRTRREFILLLAGAAFCSLRARAEQSPPLIAVLGSGAADAPSSVTQMREITGAMRALGMTEGRDYVLQGWWANSDSSRFPALADALLARHPAAVVVSTIQSVKAVQERSRTVPIVMTGMNDPVAAGLVASLARPGGNVTGVTTMAEDLLLKLVAMAREVVPTMRSIAAMSNPTNPSHRPMIEVLQRHVTTMDVSVTTVGVATPADLDAAFAELARQRPSALFVLTDNSLLALSDAIVARALSQGVPTFGNYSLDFVRAGAVFGYARDTKEAFESVARLLKRILGGANPADLPVEQPTKFKLRINLRTAQALGIAIPPTLLATADEVIE